MKKIPLFLLFAGLAAVLSGCSLFSGLGPNCDSGKEIRPGNLATGAPQADATMATLCTDKAQYEQGDTVHITFTVKNLLDEQIVLDGGQQLVMDICIWQDQCVASSQPAEAQLTRLVLEPGQSHTLSWNWPTPESDLQKALGQTNVVLVSATWVGIRGGVREVSIQLNYGPRKALP